MHRLFHSLICSVVLSVCVVAIADAQAASIVLNFGGTPLTMTPTAAQVAMLTSMQGRENARRAAQTPALTAWTLEEFVQSLIVKMVAGYHTESRGLDQAEACTMFKTTLTPAQQAAIATTLGGKSPCP